VTVYKIINPSDPYHLTADDLVLAAIAACLLGHGKYALEATDGSEGVPLFLFGGHDEWFAAQGAGSFDAALTAATGQRAEALAEVLESVTIVGTRSSLNDIGEAAARLAVGVRRMVAQAHERTPYDAMGPVDAPNPPAVRASLADVQPGGMVRLGDAPWPEIDAILADAYSAGAEGLPFEGIARRAAVRKAVAALSAQPSPGGQGDAREQFEEYRGGDCERDAQGYYVNARTAQDWAMWQAALAARQPVVVDLPESLHDRVEALREVAARQPVGEPVIDYEDLVDQAKDLIQCGCSVNGAFDWLLEQLTDGEVLASPAQAVDLGRWSQRHADDLHVAVHTALSVHAGALSQKKRAAISAYVKRLLIDSQAVGNG